ncbi:Cyclin [Gracilaria domingensis]|nr:Cyclin [Gracilaria domingensis]
MSQKDRHLSRAYTRNSLQDENSPQALETNAVFSPCPESTSFSTTTPSITSSRFHENCSASCSSQSLSPSRLTNCELLISVLECYMTMQIRRNDRFLASDSESPSATPLGSQDARKNLSIFHSVEAPGMTPVEYLRRVAEYAICSRSAFIVAFFYLEKVTNLQNPMYTVDSRSIHRFLLTATLLAIKVVDDIFCDNHHIALVGGIDVQELNVLELNMLHMLKFELFVSVEQYCDFEQFVFREVMSCDDDEACVIRELLRDLGYSVDELR